MTPLVLIPGMMCDARLFGPQIAALSRDRAVMTAPITGADRVEALAEAVLAAAPGRFALAGLSMGGIVAMEVVRRAPERVERLALMDTNHLPEGERAAAVRAPQIEAVRAGRLAEVTREQARGYLAPGSARSDILDLVLDMALALGADVFAAQSRALMARPDQSETLRMRCGSPPWSCASATTRSARRATTRRWPRRSRTPGWRSSRGRAI